MLTVQTTLTSLKTRQVNGQRGPSTLHIFTDAGGQDYTTFDLELASRAQALLGQPVTVSYESGGVNEYGEKRYLNAVAATGGAPVQPVVAVAPTPASQPQTPPRTFVSGSAAGSEDRTVSIQWQVAAKIATEFITSGKVDSVSPFKDWKVLTYEVYQFIAAGPAGYAGGGSVEDFWGSPVAAA